MHMVSVQQKCTSKDSDSVTYKKVQTKFHKDTIIDGLYHTRLWIENEAVPAATFEMLFLVTELTSDALLKVSTIISLSVTEASLSDAMPNSLIGDVNTKFSMSATPLPMKLHGSQYNDKAKQSTLQTGESCIYTRAKLMRKWLVSFKTA